MRSVSEKFIFFLQKIRRIEYYFEALEVIMLQPLLTINASNTFLSVYDYYSDIFRFLKLKTLDLDTSCFRYLRCVG